MRDHRAIGMIEVWWRNQRKPPLVFAHTLVYEPDGVTGERRRLPGASLGGATAPLAFAVN